MSGDSLGRVMFWDGRTGTLLQSMTTHDADVLALVVDQDGTGVFASGVDHKIVHLRNITVDGTGADAIAGEPAVRHRRSPPAPPPHERAFSLAKLLTWRAAPLPVSPPRRLQRRKWVLAGKRRDHTHDVRALALIPGPAPLVVSGGVDANLLVYLAEGFGQQGTCHRKVPPFSHVRAKSERRYLFRVDDVWTNDDGTGQRPLLHVAPAADLLLFENEGTLEVWHTPHKTVKNAAQELTVRAPPFFERLSRAGCVCCLFVDLPRSSA